MGVLGLAGCGGQLSAVPSAKSQAPVKPQAKGPGGTAIHNQGVQPANNVAMASAATPKASVSPNKAQLISKTMALAKSGRVANIPFAAGTGMIDQVQNTWGKPASEDAAGAGFYDTYTAYHAAFGFNKGSQLFDVRSYAPRFQALTLGEVEAVLGPPAELRYTTGSTIVMYPAGPDYQLLWAFQSPNASNSNVHVDHVSVFCPAATVDLMAENVSSPVLTVSPGKGDLIVTVDQPPKGFQLEELEWIAADGTAVITTYSQAIHPPSSAQRVSHFTISKNGSIAFYYSPSLARQSGMVKVVYQEPSGMAVIGESNPLNLPAG